MEQGGIWAVVLAGGSGVRLSSLTVDWRGRAVPKQYCSLQGGTPLLMQAVHRARALAPPERVCAVVAAEHWHWWEPLEQHFAAGNLIVQPANRGTGNGVLLAAITILDRDPDARIVFLPADHYVQRESVLTLAARDALDGLRPGSADVALVTITPDGPDTELGYVVPKAQENLDLREVESFVEKPDRERARALIAQGAMWNSMIFAAHGAGLIELFTRHFPCTVTRMKVLAARNSEPESPSLQLVDLYERLPSIDFSRDVLQEATERLRVSRAQPCGWSDLGTPSRVEEIVLGMGRKPPVARAPERYSGVPPDLSEVVRRRLRETGRKAVARQGELEASV
jgi:mannose-1-phosphate guanylyltransferase